MAPYLKNLAKQKQDIRYVVEAMNQVLQGAIQVLRIADGGGGGGCQIFREKALLTKV